MLHLQSLCNLNIYVLISKSQLNNEFNSKFSENADSIVYVLLKIFVVLTWIQKLKFYGTLQAGVLCVSNQMLLSYHFQKIERTELIAILNLQLIVDLLSKISCFRQGLELDRMLNNKQSDIYIYLYIYSDIYI